MQPAAVRAQYGESQFAGMDTIAALGKLAGRFQHQPAYRVIFFIAEFRAERFIEIGDLGVCLDAPLFLVFAIRDDVVLILVKVILIPDAADILPHHVFTRHHAGSAAVLTRPQRDKKTRWRKLSATS